VRAIFDEGKPLAPVCLRVCECGAFGPNASIAGGGRLSADSVRASGYAIKDVVLCVPEVYLHTEKFGCGRVSRHCGGGVGETATAKLRASLFLRQ
jgi:hypothetical protein